MSAYQAFYLWTAGEKATEIASTGNPILDARNAKHA